MEDRERLVVTGLTPEHKKFLGEKAERLGITRPGVIKIIISKQIEIEKRDSGLYGF